MCLVCILVYECGAENKTPAFFRATSLARLCVQQRPPRKATGAAKGSSNTAGGAGASSKPKRKPAKAASATEGEKRSPNPAAGRKPRGAGGGGARRGRAKEEEEEEEVPNDARKYFKEGQKHITPPNVRNFSAQHGRKFLVSSKNPTASKQAEYVCFHEYMQLRH